MSSAATMSPATSEAMIAGPMTTISLKTTSEKATPVCPKLSASGPCG
jgi:hypothetical protein